MKQIAEVWGEMFGVAVCQHSKTVWIAIGKYNSREIPGKGRSARRAVVSWQNIARYRAVTESMFVTLQKTPGDFLELPRQIGALDVLYLKHLR